jgi:hopene-associated glycosyltransferase HpnB
VSGSVGLGVAVLSAGIWVYLVFFRGAFWRLSDFDDDRRAISAEQKFPRVCAIVPARNEAATIAATVTSLMQQDYPGEFSVAVVDDHSNDGTSQIARETSARATSTDGDVNARGDGNRFAIYFAAALQTGWTGKLWALNEGVRHVWAEAEQRGGAVEFFWFTDADIQHAPDTLRRLVARAESDRLDMASLMVLLRARTPPEKLLIPAFVYFFLQLYPPRWIADPKTRTAGAAGGCLLIRDSALRRIGGLTAVRGELIDDCMLARAVKRAGGRLWMGVTRSSASLRDYTGFAEIRDMIARTAFTQLRYSAPLLFLTIVALFLTYLAPVALLFTGANVPRTLSIIACVLMAASFLPTIRYYCLSPAWALLLPAVAAFYAYATLLSAVRFWLGRGGQWKGRAQAPPCA